MIQNNQDNSPEKSNKKQIKLSICMITFNHERFIKQALESVLMQKVHFEYEIVIGEDDSRDETRKILIDYKAKYPDKIRLILNKKNIGAQRNFCKAFWSCRGEYIALLEGDDYWVDPYKLQKQFELMEKNPNYAGCFHETQQIYADGKIGKVYGKEASSVLHTEDTFATLSPFHTSSFLFKNVIGRFPKWFSEIASGDMALFSMVSSHGPLIKIAEIMSVYRKLESGMTSDEKIVGSYHSDRIKLNQSLNSYHKYKYDKKASQVIAFHETNLVKQKESENGDTRLEMRNPSPPTANQYSSANDKYLNNSLTPDNMDLYFVRLSIEKAIDRSLHHFRGTLLDVGCGEMPYREYLIANSGITKYIGLDLDNDVYQQNSKPDLYWDGIHITLPDNSINCAMATEVLEHVPDIETVLCEISRVLKPGGTMFFTIPYLWPLHDAPFDEYRYTPFSLKRHFQNSGFDHTDIRALGGWNASLAQMIGLWINRSGLPIPDRNRYAEQFFPFYKALIESDTTDTEFTSQTMFTGLFGIASKKGNKITTSDMKNNLINTKTSHKQSPFGTQTSKNKKIVVMQGGFPALSITFIIDMICGLVDHGFEIENWAIYNPEEPKIHKKIESYNLISKTKYIKFPPEKLKFEPLVWTEEFCKLNGIEDFDDIGAFHIHYGSIYLSIEPLLKTLDKFVLVSFHGYDASRYFKENGDDCYSGLFKRANMITTPSYHMKNELVNRGCLSDKITIHRYGIDLLRFKNRGRSFRKEKIVFLTVGRFVEKKGIEDSIKAFGKIANKFDCEYRIIGKGDLLNRYSEIISSTGISSKVKFLGPKTMDEVIAEMRNADIFVLTSVTATDGDCEGVPVALIEAHAAGLPVVSTFHAGIPELVINNNTGFLSEEKDIDNIAENMMKLAKDANLRQQYSKSAVDRVKDEFDIKLLNKKLASYLLGEDSQPRNEYLLTALKNRNWEHKLITYSDCFHDLEFFSKIDKPDISIIVISWHLHPDSLKSFEILEKQRDQNFELIFVDNGAEVGAFDALKPFVNTYIRLNTNTGAYLARNIGALFAQAPALFFLEDDGIPANNLIKAHLDAFAKYDVISVRGVCKAKSGDNPLNKLANHYYLGDLPFPRYSDLEGNSAYDSKIFFKVGGWDDEIYFGGGGIDLAIRLMSLEPDMRKQIYSPEPVIFHDYATDGEHLKKKRQKQIESFERLRRKHQIFDSFHRAWARFIGHYELIPRRITQSGSGVTDISTQKNTLLDDIYSCYQSGDMQQTAKLLGKYQQSFKQGI